MQIVGIVLAAVLAPTAASAADTVSVVGTPDCGYDASTNTFRPVATVVRNSFGQLNPDNTHVGVSMQLFDGTTQIGSTLNTGKVGTTGNAAVDLPLVNDTAQVTLNASPLVVFGDGSAAGGTLPPAPHTYTLRVRMLDFTDLDVTIISPDFTCDTTGGGGVSGADLSVTKSGTPQRVNVGDVLTYEIIVTNNGPDTAAGVQVTDQIPFPLVTLIDYSSSVGSCTDLFGRVSCDLGDLVVGGSASVTIRVNSPNQRNRGEHRNS